VTARTLRILCGSANYESAQHVLFFLLLLLNRIKLYCAANKPVAQLEV